jgi:hypothetical protein
MQRDHWLEAYFEWKISLRPGYARKQKENECNNRS